MSGCVRSPQLLTEGRQDGGLHAMGSIFQSHRYSASSSWNTASQILNYLSVQQMVLLQNGANI